MARSTKLTTFKTNAAALNVTGLFNHDLILLTNPRRIGTFKLHIVISPGYTTNEMSVAVVHNQVELQRGLHPYHKCMSGVVPDMLATATYIEHAHTLRTAIRAGHALESFDPRG